MKNILASAALIALASGCVNAQSQTSIVYGKVIAVEPQTRIVSVQKPFNSCTTIEVPVYGNVGGGASSGDILGGMIIGGLLGKGVSGNDKGAAAGAVLGGMISADNNRGSKAIVGYRQENRCTTEYITELQERRNGYKVTIEVEDTIFTKISNRSHRVGQTVEVHKAYSY